MPASVAKLPSNKLKPIAGPGKAGFSGKRRDKLGHERCYRNGKPVPCNRLTPTKPKPAASEAVDTGAHPGTEHGSTVKVKKTNQRAWDGKNPVPTQTTLTKQETGRVGEAIAIAYMRDILGRSDARAMNSKATNYPVDTVEDHRPTEIKAGLASNARKSQQWRLTFSQESKKEKEKYAKMTKEEKAFWNKNKQARIRDRKEKVLKGLEQKTGEKHRPKTLTVVINPDTKTADVYYFDGWHDRIDWQSKEARAAYQGSVTYE